MGGLEITVEGEELTSHTSPESVGVLDGLIIELLVLVQVLHVGSAGVLLVEGLGNVEGVDLMGLKHLGDDFELDINGSSGYTKLASTAVTPLARRSQADIPQITIQTYHRGLGSVGHDF